MTNEQINVALAKWHSEHDTGDVLYRFYGGTLLRITGLSPPCLLTPYTDSLDTMRLIEDLMTDEQWPTYSNAILWGGIYIIPKDILLANAERRARAAVTALGLEGNE